MAVMPLGSFPEFDGCTSGGYVGAVLLCAIHTKIFRDEGYQVGNLLSNTAEKMLLYHSCHLSESLLLFRRNFKYVF